MSDHKQTIDICNISLSYHRPPSHEEQGQQSSKWDGDPKITISSTNSPRFSLKQHNRTIKALLPFPHCLISAGYLRYLCGCSYLWPSACCFVVPPPTHTHTYMHSTHATPPPPHPPTCSHPPTPVCCDLQWGVITPWPIWRSPHVECAYAESLRICTVWGEVKYLQKYDLTRFIKWGKMKTKQLLVLS